MTPLLRRLVCPLIAGAAVFGLTPSAAHAATPGINLFTSSDPG
jgi:hypothetical protein